jgi:hypothetical protein
MVWGDVIIRYQTGVIAAWLDVHLTVGSKIQ